jgi:MoxR-like ATPase
MMSEPTPQQAVSQFQSVFRRIRTQLGRVIVGQDELLDQILIAFFAGGHVLIEGLPGTGKTLIVRSLAQALNLSFNRIQFTVDLMPADITGTRILLDRDGRRELSFVPGPLFAHVLLADEINRATPKTQSALLEAMAELQVTVAGTTYPIAPPFFVLATLNPIEMEGTYPLPEAQLDRFMFKVVLPYPTGAEMQRIIGMTTAAGTNGGSGGALSAIEPVFPQSQAAAEVDQLRALVREVIVAPHIEEYAAGLVRATLPAGSKFTPPGPALLPANDRVDRYVSFGSSPRGGQALLLGAKVSALLDGRVNLTYDDIDRVAVPSLSHRLVLNFGALADGVDPRELIGHIVDGARRLRN